MGRLARFIRFYTEDDEGTPVEPTYETAIGNPVTFTAKAAPLRQLSVSLSPIQSGSGDPSPDNVRPITGYDSLTVYQSGEDTSDPTTIPISIPTPPGTVYGGTLDVLTGVLTVTHASVNMGALSWAKWGTNKGFYALVGTGAAQAKGSAGIGNDICSIYKSDTYARVASKANPACFNIANTTHYIYLYDATQEDTSATDFTTYINGQTLCYELTTPQTYQLTPQEVNSLLGTNNMWSDDGTTLTVEYRSN